MEHLLVALLVVAALIHVPPLAGVRGGAVLHRLYGVSVEDPNLRVMLRHRALLFAPVVLALLRAVWDPDERPWGLAVGLWSAGSYLLLCRGGGGLTGAMRRVFRADAVAVAALVAAALLSALGAR